MLTKHYTVGNKWELTRLAIRICTASDLHKRPPRNLSLMEQQMRKRVFWSAYINERHASSNLGTPMAIQETDITTDVWEFPHSNCNGSTI